jgi:chromosomal replication initiation ATPase DnaA
VLNLAHGNFVKERQNLLIVGASGLGKTHLLIGVGRALCQRGYKVLFRTAAALATELELAQRELRLPRLLAQLRRFDLVLVDELGYLPFSQTAAELLFQFLDCCDLQGRGAGAMLASPERGRGGKGWRDATPTHRTRTRGARAHDGFSGLV